MRSISVFLFLAFCTLIVGAIGIDALLHRLGLAWVGRYGGMAGASLILGSFSYSLRKRNIVSWGSLQSHLKWHEAAAWSGSLLILVHGGIHFSALLPWYALLAMIVSNASGLTGKLLLNHSQKGLSNPGPVGENETLRHSLTYKLMKRWRLVHLPITVVFGMLSFLHILTVLIFWNWR